MFDPNAMNMQDLTTDDVSRINKAMKTEQFGNLMQDYLDEISDPKNRDEYDHTHCKIVVLLLVLSRNCI